MRVVDAGRPLPGLGRQLAELRFANDILLFALVCVDLLLRKAGRYGMPVWVASLDLQKAFDRVRHEPLFVALLDAGLPLVTSSCCKPCTVDKQPVSGAAPPTSPCSAGFGKDITKPR